MQKVCISQTPIHTMIRQFTPNWFTVCMGTGAAALIISEFPVLLGFTWSAGAALWHFNILLFILFSVLYALRWIYYPAEAKQIFKHPMMCLFLGAIPMALATIINGFFKYGQFIYGSGVMVWAEMLWYADVILAIATAWLVPFMMFQRQEHQLQNMTAVWLLPIVACEVAASSGGMLVAHLPANAHAASILLGSYVLWGISVLPAFAILSILMLRLALHKLPAKELAGNWPYRHRRFGIIAAGRSSACSAGKYWLCGNGPSISLCRHFRQSDFAGFWPLVVRYCSHDHAASCQKRYAV